MPLHFKVLAPSSDARLYMLLHIKQHLNSNSTNLQPEFINNKQLRTTLLQQQY